MLHDKPDELSNLKHKLDDLEGLPQEAPFDKSAAWQKLQHRIDKEPAVKLKSWYWIAAACLLLLAGSTWLKRDDGDKNITSVSPEPTPENIIVIEPSATDTLLQNTPRIVEDKQQHFTSKVKSNTKKFLSPEPVQLDSPSLKQIEVARAPQEEIVIALSPDTMRAAQTIVVKKKLRVVHINELDKPGTIPDQFALNMAARTLQQTGHPQDVFHGLEFSRNASDNLLKIKLPSSN